MLVIRGLESSDRSPWHTGAGLDSRAVTSRLQVENFNGKCITASALSISGREQALLPEIDCLRSRLVGQEMRCRSAALRSCTANAPLHPQTAMKT